MAAHKKKKATRKKAAKKTSKKKVKRKAPAKKKKATEKKVPKKMGRPRVKIDWDQVAKMGAIQCTAAEIAAVLEVDAKTLYNACKREHGMTFARWIEEKGVVGKMSLRRKQYTTAMSGNVTMLIWLGKNWLGQSDQSRVEATVEHKVEQSIVIGGKTVKF